MLRKRKAQSMIEFTVLTIVLVCALVVMSTYIKRGFQGRWKQSVDDFGDQYDPSKVNSMVTYTQATQSQTMVQAVPYMNPLDGTTVYMTNRSDSSTTSESKQGNVFVAK